MTITITLLCLSVAAYLAICLFKAITDPLTHIKQVIHHLALGKLETRVSSQKSREGIRPAHERSEKPLQHERGIRRRYAACRGLS